LSAAARTSNSKKTKETSKAKGGEDLLRAIKDFSPSFAASKIFSKRELVAHGLGNPIIVRGTENFRLRRTVSVIGEHCPSATIQSYFPGDLNTNGVFESIKGEALGGSLFSSSKIVVFYDADLIRPNSAEKLAPIFAIDPTNTLFILIHSSESKVPKWLEELGSKAAVFELQSLSGQTLSKWIERELKRLGHNGGIEPSALTALVRSFGEDTTRLASEISKLVLFVEPESQISAKDVSVLCLAEKDASTFELLESCAEENPLRAIRILRNLDEQGMHSLQILALLSKCIRSLLASKDSGSFPLHSDIAGGWVLRNLPSSQRKFSVSDLKSALLELSKLDLGLKGSKREGPELLREFVVSLSARRTAISAAR